MATRFDVVSDIERVFLYVHYESTKKMKGKNKSLPCREKNAFFTLYKSTIRAYIAQYESITENENTQTKTRIFTSAPDIIDCENES